MDKKSEILNATYHLFSEKGYNLSMSEIAEAVKIKTPSLYSHFKSKDEIIELTIKAEVDHCFDTIYKKASKLEGKSCEEKLKFILFSSIDYYKKSSRLRFWRHIYLLQNKELRNINMVSIQERNTYLFTHIKICFDKGIKDKEIKETVNEGSIYLYFSMIQGILNAIHFIQDNGITIEQFTSMAWESYWNGIKA